MTSVSLQTLVRHMNALPFRALMVALVLATEALRKFGGDSVDELGRNKDAFLRSLG